jgi:YesN/AraC family two-component response regulator
MKVLLIDDEPFALENIKSILLKLNLDLDIIGIASTKDEAIESITKEIPDLIFLDIELAGETCFNLIDAISHLKINIIILSAHQIPSQFSDYPNIVAYLLKPIVHADLLLALQKARQTNLSKRRKM